MARKKRNRRRLKKVEQVSLEAAYRRFDEMHEATTSTVGIRDSYSLSAWVYSAITIICDWITQNPFVIEQAGSIVQDGSLSRLASRPNRYGQQNTCKKFITAYMSELLLSGSIMRVFTEMDGIEPRQMVVMPRHKFTAMRGFDEHGMEIVQRWNRYNVSGNYTYTPGDDIFHDALFNPYHDWEGLAPLTAALLGINSDINLSELLNRFFSNDASTGLIMSSKEPVNATQLGDAIEAWEANHKGVKQAYGTKFIGHGFEPHQIGTTFDAAVQRVLKVLTRDEIMNGIFRIPPSIYAGDLPSEGVQIGSNSSEPEKEVFLINVIMVWADRYDTEFNLDVAPRFGARLAGRHDFSNNPILERRRLERAKAAVELIDRGVTLNHIIEWLKLELAPEPHGNEFWTRQGQVPASVIMGMGERAVPVAQPQAKKDQVVMDYIGEIVRKAETAVVKNEARSEPGRNGSSNASRIAEIMNHDS